MPEPQIAQALQLLDLMLEHFADDGHWTRGRYDDGNGGHCLVGALLLLSRKHRLPTGKYVVTTRENVQLGLPIGIVNCVNRGMMEDRVKAFHTANVFEPHTYNHLLGPTEIVEQSGNRCRTRQNFQIIRIMENGRMDLYATGAYHDVIVVEDAGLKIQERKVVLDSRTLDILLVIPL